MYIKSLFLRNFLSHKSASVHFSPNFNIVHGANATGKTNLMDSIYMSAVGRSYRFSKDKDLINWDSLEEGAAITLEIVGKFVTNVIKIQVDSAGKKKISINDMPIYRMGELMGAANVVLFHPDELKLVKESPSDRRRFIDISISQHSKQYFYALLRYEKLLNQRNNALKQYKGLPLLESFLSIGQKDLIKTTKVIMQERKRFIEKLNLLAIEEHDSITEKEEKLRLSYESENVDYDNFERSYANLLENSAQNDERLGYTTIGPHRDDIKILCNDVDVRKFGSQGQQRSVVLSLKLAQIKLYEQALGETPILLLDDVLSEIDAKRSKAFINAIKDMQVIIAATEVPNGFEDAKIFEITKDKKIREQGSF